jgi:hypothetical protein
MSIIQTLTEGIVNRDMKKEGSALLSKWGKTGLLEGLQSEHQKSTMARLLENQAKELLREANTMSGGDVEGFAAVAFPIVRRVFAGLIANDLVSVQPMSLPSGLIFFLDFTYGEDLNGVNSQPRTRLGNSSAQSIYGTDKLGSGIITGVDLVNATTKAGFSGPGRDGSTGYAYASPTGSNTSNVPGGVATGRSRVFLLDGAVGESDAKMIKYDPDLLSLTDSTVVTVVDIAKASHASSDGDPDFDNLSPFLLNVSASGQITGLVNVTNIAQIRRLTDKVAAADSQLSAESIRYVFTVDSSAATVANASADLATPALAAGFEYPLKDTAGVSTAPAGAIDAYQMPLEANADIPEIDIKVDSTAITAQTKKLKAKWSPELGQDLNAYHNLDAEVELTSILSEQIALEIDREILADLVNGATAATYYWSRSPGLFVNRETGAELGAISAAPDFTGTVSEWYETLIETINDVSAQIHRKTLRGGANYVVVSPEVANILEFTSGFRANVTADADKGEIGAVKTGSLSRKFDVIVDPYFPRNLILVGRKGNSFLESGYVYAPYVPLQTTPTIFGVEDFVPRKGVMTRYAKKMVRPDMYGLVIVRGLLGESGS